MTESIIQDYVPDAYGDSQLRRDEGERMSPVDKQTASGSKPARDRGASITSQGATERPEQARQFEGVTPQMAQSGSRHEVQHSTVNIPSHAESSETASSSSGWRRDEEQGVLDPGEGDQGVDPALSNWPSPGQSHGYASKHAHMLKGQGPAPFLTPGPHRHKLVPSPSEG